MCKLPYWERSAYACLPSTLFCASADCQSNIVYEIFVLFDHYLPLCWRYGLESLWDCTEFIRPFGHLPLISGHAIVFTCHYIILFINYSRCSKLSSASVLLSLRKQWMFKFFFRLVVVPTQIKANRYPWRWLCDSLSWKVFIQGDKYMQCIYNVILRGFGATIVVEQILHILCVCVFVTLGMQYAMPKCYIFICGLTGCTVFFHCNL
jgi:hypothetical protein